MGTTKIALKYLFALIFIVAGVLHFRYPAAYLRIMPPYLPFPMALHLIAGFLEAVFGIGLLIPKYQRWAAWGLVLLLIAVFPANIHMAINHQLYDLPMFYHYIRLPLQFVLIAWAWWYTRE
jgi:uncharacterized membrane protein